ncbi:UDP-N-acetylmuramoyl-L-alanine--D-glutamate ligase [bacterium]|nr:UDP-N-acetylmuramoyl-L-alanine--D-glutamate ligase [bacterium]
MIRVLVIGGGISGLAAARLAKKRGFEVRISDRSVIPEETRHTLTSAGIEVADGGHLPSHLDQVTRVILSPGVRADHLLCKLAAERGIPMESEIDFALDGYSGRLVAVTGTNGKSTTVSMTGHILDRCGIDVSVGGNLGDPPSDMIARGDLKSNLVLEISSYQLEQSSPHPAVAAAITSFSNDHVDRHGTLEAYFAAKWKVFDWVIPGGLCVMTDEVARFANRFGKIRRQDVRWVVVPGFAHDARAAEFVREARVSGRHNEINVEISVQLAAQLTGNLDYPVLARMIEDFRGLPFRCQLLGTLAGHSVFNDSKSTNCESTVAALAGMKSPVVLMMGGKGKGESYLPVLAWKQHVAALVCFGESGQSIADELSLDLRAAGIETTTRRGMREAIDDAVSHARRLDCGILFSPGCASFDEFRNFEHRGQDFNDAIAAFIEGPPQRDGN